MPEEDKEKAPTTTGPAAQISQAAPQTVEMTHKNKKINKMSLKELEARLKEIKTKTGNLHSCYAGQLIRQRDILSRKS
jgi:hypothetical protein